MKYNVAKWTIEDIDFQSIDTDQIRKNDFIFYVAAASSFLETTVPVYVKNLTAFLEKDIEISKWLNEVWEPEEVNHGRAMRSYIEHVWPEYNWRNAYSSFRKNYLNYCKVELLRPTCALEMLARCVTETGAANFYRMVYNYIEEPIFSNTMKNMFQDEVRHYSVFFKKYEQYNKEEKVSFFQKFKLVISRNQIVSEEDLYTAFQHINSGWEKSSPFQLKEYRAIISTIGNISKLHFPYDMARNMLFRPFNGRNILEKLATKPLEKICKIKLKGLIA
jgi:hypothetical protein